MSKAAQQKLEFREEHSQRLNSGPKRNSLQTFRKSSVISAAADIFAHLSEWSPTAARRFVHACQSQPATYTVALLCLAATAGRRGLAGYRKPQKREISDSSAIRGRLVASEGDLRSAAAREPVFSRISGATGGPTAANASQQAPGLLRKAARPALPFSTLLHPVNRDCRRGQCNHGPSRAGAAVCFLNGSYDQDEVRAGQDEVHPHCEEDPLHRGEFPAAAVPSRVKLPRPAALSRQLLPLLRGHASLFTKPCTAFLWCCVSCAD